jgi:hypothetical protein
MNKDEKKRLSALLSDPDSHLFFSFGDLKSKGNGEFEQEIIVSTDRPVSTYTVTLTPKE